MNLYRFLVVKYRPQDPGKPMVNIGVIVQGQNEIDCKFNKNISRVTSVVSDEEVDSLIFERLEDTFKNNFKSGSFWITDKATGQKREVKYTDPFYLEYLTTNFLNNYYFNNFGQLEANSLQEGLIRVYNMFVDQNYREEPNPQRQLV